MREIKIKAQFTGVISTGSYENERPLFEVEETIQMNETESAVDTYIRKRQKELHGYCYDMFKTAEKRSIAERIKKEREDIRFYEFGGDQYPSVTSIIGWDYDFHMNPKDLQEYASRGSIIHAQISHYIETGKWESPKDLPECYADLVILKKGALGLQYDDVDYISFEKKYPIDYLAEQCEMPVYNHSYRYAGRQDIKGIPTGDEWEKLGVKQVVSLFDVKTGVVDKVKYFKQLDAYANCEGNEDVEQLVIIPLSNKTQQGFSKPLITERNKFFQMFLKDRQQFKNRFQI